MADLKRCYDAFKVQRTFHYVELDPKEVAVLESLLIDCYGPPANRVRGARLKDPVPAGG